MANVIITVNITLNKKILARKLSFQCFGHTSEHPSLPFLVVLIVAEVPLPNGRHDQLALPQVAHLYHERLLRLFVCVRICY